MLTARIRMRLDDDFGRDQRRAARHPLPALPRADPVALDRADARRPGRCERDRRAAGRSRHAAASASPAGACAAASAPPIRSTLWPLEVASTELVTATAAAAHGLPEARSALRIRLRDARAARRSASSALDALRFFLDGAGLAHRRPRALPARSASASRCAAGREARRACCGPEAIRAGRLRARRGPARVPEESFLGYRLLQEYFAFPEKFLFVELAGLEQHADSRRRVARAVDPPARAGRRPRRARPAREPAARLHADREPVRDGDRPDPDHAHRRRVPGHSRRAQPALVRGALDPLGLDACERGTETVRAASRSSRIDTASDAGEGVYWYAARRAALRKDDSGTDLFVSLVDERVRARWTSRRATCCTSTRSAPTASLPARLAFGDPNGDLDVQGRPGVTRIAALRKPTEPLRAAALRRRALAAGLAPGAEPPVAERRTRARASPMRARSTRCARS